jgi:hypothetical protein
MPSALALIAFAYGVGSLGEVSNATWLHGLKIAVVAQAGWNMARSLCPDRERVTLAVAATMFTLAILKQPARSGPLWREVSMPPLISTKCPAFAAAAIAGETRWVWILKLWRSSSLRFNVEAQRAPGCVALAAIHETQGDSSR